MRGLFTHAVHHKAPPQTPKLSSIHSSLGSCPHDCFHSLQLRPQLLLLCRRLPYRHYPVPLSAAWVHVHSVKHLSGRVEIEGKKDDSNKQQETSKRQHCVGVAKGFDRHSDVNVPRTSEWKLTGFVLAQFVYPRIFSFRRSD